MNSFEHCNDEIPTVYSGAEQSALSVNQCTNCLPGKPFIDWIGRGSAEIISGSV
jgi:hypothetical protein